MSNQATLASHSVVFHSEGLVGYRLDVRRLNGLEELSQPYRFEVVVAVEAPLPDEALDEALAAPAYWAFGEQHEHKVHGRVRAIQLIPTLPGRELYYQLTLVPRLWDLGLFQGSRVWESVSATDVLQRILAEHGMADYAHFGIAQRRPAREYTLQHDESELAFVSRLLEHEGVWTAYAQTEGGERLLVGDANAHFPRAAPHQVFVYAPVENHTDVDDKVLAFATTRKVVARAVSVRDYNYRAALVPIAQTVETSPGPADMGGQFSFGEHARDAADARRLATLRAEAIAAGRVVCTGRSRIRGLHPGQRFTLEGHPVPSQDMDYVVTSVRHAVVQGSGPGHDQAYYNEFECLPFATTFRPARRTPRPRIEGVLHGRIDGPQPGSAAPIDEQGRYRVVLLEDATPVSGGRQVHPVRAATLLAGAGYGIHFPLHIGTEVLIGHVNGDPDRPYIAAAMPNSNAGSPVVRDNSTQSILRTQGMVEIVFDDDARPPPDALVGPALATEGAAGPGQAPPGTPHTPTAH